MVKHGASYLSLTHDDVDELVHATYMHPMAVHGHYVSYVHEHPNQTYMLLNNGYTVQPVEIKSDIFSGTVFGDTGESHSFDLPNRIKFRYLFLFLPVKEHVRDGRGVRDQLSLKSIGWGPPGE